MTGALKEQKLLKTIDSIVEGIYWKSPTFFSCRVSGFKPRSYQLLTAGMSPFLPLHVAGRVCLSQLTGYGGGDKKDDSKNI
jgi:hypothetical protein